MTPIEFYTGLLASNSLEIKEEGRFLLTPNSQVPLQVSKKTLSLPTEEVLATYNDHKDKIQIFHPVSENILRRDSPVFNFLKRLYRNTISVEFELFSRNLLAYAMDGTLSSKASKKKREYLTGFKDLDENTLKNYEKMIERVDPQGEHKLVDFTVQRGGEINGEKFSRICHIRFPLLKLLVERDEKPFGVKLRKKDYDNLIRLHEVIFGEGIVEQMEKGDIWKEVGTNNASAPNFVCLTQAYALTKAKLIALVDTFGNQFPEMNNKDMAWLAGLDQVDVYRALIPTFEGNDGEPLPQQEERKVLQPKEPVKVTPLGTRREIKPQEEPKTSSAKPKLWFEAMESYQREYNDYEYGGSRRERRRESRDIDLNFVEGNQRDDRRDRYSHDRGYRSGRGYYADDRRSRYDDYDGFGWSGSRGGSDDRGYYRR